VLPEQILPYLVTVSNDSVDASIQTYAYREVPRMSSTKREEML
jgi:hypothetical protein